MNELLKMEQITKKFGSAVANESVNFSVNRGEVHTLLGENGAGKSTLMNILVGLYQPTSGQIYMHGKPVTIDSPSIAVKYGIGMVHQHFMLIEAMTVFENIILGQTKNTSLFINEAGIKKEIMELSDMYGLDINLDKKITDISVGEQQRVEIVKALYRGAEILILDEPTAVLTDEETEGLFSIIRKLTSENKSVIFISHKMREVMSISNRITILRLGKSIETLSIENTSATELANKMVGREVKESTYEKVTETKDAVLSLEHISYNKSSKHTGLSDITFSISKGEIFGIAGVDGNGQSQLASLLAGLIKPEEGVFLLKNEEITHFSPQEMIDRKISHIPEDRNKMGLVGDMTVSENLILKSTESKELSNGKGWHLKKKNISKHSEEMCQKYDIRCSSKEQIARNLSGGNQQKIILARELEQNPDLLIAVHPTRGLDIGATQYVHDCMIEARDKGCAILLISADLDEVLMMSDRLAVMYEGQIVNIYSGANPPIKEISLAMAGKVQAV